MNTFLTISLNDLRATFREPIFRGMFLFPFLSFAIVRWVLPLLMARYPALAGYTLVILMWACLQAGTMFGFMYGFLLLEEKEEQIWQVIRVLPVSGLRLLLARLFLGLVIAAVVNFCLLHWGGVADLPLLQELLLALQFSLAAPLIALWLDAMAGNRIEGLAQMKLLNLLLVLPGLVYFLPYKAVHVLALVPTYWSFRSMEMAAAAGNRFWVYYLVGVLLYLVVLYVLNRKRSRGEAAAPGLPH